MPSRAWQAQSSAGAAGIENRSLVAGRKFNDKPDYSVEVIAAPELAVEARSGHGDLSRKQEIGPGDRACRQPPRGKNPCDEQGRVRAGKRVWIRARI